jgi:pimeloyl-ACP methyl ester carboxylesterase
MRTLRHAGTAALAVLGLATAGLGSAATAGATSSPASSSSSSSLASSSASRSLAWAACGPRLECADVTVPLDWDEPRGPTITLPVTRHLASSPAQRIGSLFVQPGGPGDSAVETVQTRGEALDAMTGGRFDVVGWDIRGAGGTARVDCFGDRAARAAFWVGKALPTTAAEERAYLATTADFSRRCGARNRELLRHISTADTARDLDHLRRLVRDRQLTYFGESYGTLIGQTYLNMFPGRVRAIVLDGLLDPVAGAAGTAATLSAGLTVTDETVRQFAATCEVAGPERCALAGHGPVLPRIEAVFDRLRQSPLPAPNASTPGELTFGEAMGTLKYAILPHPSLWPIGAAALAEAAKGDGSYIEEEALFDQGELFHRLVEPGQAILCADSPARQGPRQWPGVVRGMARISDVGAIPMGWGMGAACTTWPERAEDRYTGPWTATTRTPVLLVNNRYDPNAPLDGARRIERLLGNAVLLVHDGYGHLSASDPSTCVTRAMGGYLTDLAVPRRGARCPSDRPPFDPAFGTPVG